MAMEPTSDLSVVMAALYRSEINCSVYSFWDSGWTAKLGDEMNGYRAISTMMYSTAEVAEWMTKEACEYWPTSGFAQNVDDLSRWVGDK